MAEQKYDVKLPDTWPTNMLLDMRHANDDLPPYFICIPCRDYDVANGQQHEGVEVRVHLRHHESIDHMWKSVNGLYNKLLADEPILPYLQLHHSIKDRRTFCQWDTKCKRPEGPITRGMTIEEPQYLREAFYECVRAIDEVPTYDEIRSRQRADYIMEQLKTMVECAKRLNGAIPSAAAADWTMARVRVSTVHFITAAVNRLLPAPEILYDEMELDDFDYGA